MHNIVAHKKDYKLHILVLQTITVALILVFAVLLRSFGGKAYHEISVWYHQKFDDITLTDEVLNPKDNEESSVGTNETEDENRFVQQNQSQASIDIYEGEYDSVIDSELSGNITNFDNVESTAALSSINTFQWPVVGKISSQYGWRKNPVTGKFANHNGLDIAANTGTDIYAAFDGIVTKANYSSSYGYYIIIDHGGKTQTLYAHCSKLCVEEGKKVKKGDIIALVGSTGRSTGPHLHFEVRVSNYRIDPEWILSELNVV